jgi:hypothetical protein
MQAAIDVSDDDYAGHSAARDLIEAILGDEDGFYLLAETQQEMFVELPALQALGSAIIGALGVQDRLRLVNMGQILRLESVA